MSFKFEAFQPTPWEGRYSRIPGDTSVFHLEIVNGRWWPTIKWAQDGGLGTCIAKDSAAIRQLAQSVNAAKVLMGGSGGGSFVINEFGKVIVPSSNGGGKRMLAGSITGKLIFDNPFEDDEVIDISDVSGLQVGQELTIPYVGTPFNLSGKSQIYFYKIDSEGGGSVYPPVQDPELIAAIRKVRRSGPVKFIVNPYGIVATKKPMDAEWGPEEKWTPVFVGKINFAKWFNKE